MCVAMSEASTQQTASRALALVLCPVCGQAVIQTFDVRHAGENYGRRFYKCHNKDSGLCTFWKWHEEYAGTLATMRAQVAMARSGIYPGVPAVVGRPALIPVHIDIPQAQLRFLTILSVLNLLATLVIISRMQ